MTKPLTVLKTDQSDFFVTNSRESCHIYMTIVLMFSCLRLSNI